MSGTRVYDGPGFACGRCGRFDQEPWHVAYDEQLGREVWPAKECECGEAWWLPVTLSGQPGKGQYHAPCEPTQHAALASVGETE